MMNLVRRFTKDDSGAVMVLVALALVVILGCMALVIDVGVVYAERMKASNAVDAAVLAGVRELPSNPSTALTVAQTYAQANGLDSTRVSFQIQDSGKSIKGFVDYDQTAYFAKIFNIEKFNVKPVAKAKVGLATNLGKGTGIVPLGVQQEDIDKANGAPIVLKEGGGSGTQGWYGSLDLESLTGGNSGAKTYERYLTYGYDGDGSVYKGTLILEENGNMNAANRNAIDYRINKCLGIGDFVGKGCGQTCTAASHNPNCPRLVIVPVGEMIDKKHFEVTGFAAFFITDYTGNGNENFITGQFVEPVDIPNAEIDDTMTDNGVYTRVLVE